MTSQQLDIFLRLSQSLNFRKVAEELYTTQPTVSRQLRLLEEEWGMELFVRTNREVRLTPEGVIMLEHVKKALDILSAGQQKARTSGENPAGEINIGIPEFMDPGYFAARAIAFLGENYPEINISLKKCSFADLRNKLEDRSLDIVFTPDFDLRNYKDIVSNDFDRVQCGFVVGKGHPLAKYDEIDIEAFSEETYILPDESDSPGRRDDLLMILGRLGIHAKKIIYAPNTESVMIKVMANQGIAVSDTTSNLARDDSFKYFPVPDPIGNFKISYVWKKDNLNPVLALFTNILVRRSSPVRN